jgi:hypothetical protein
MRSQRDRIDIVGLVGVKIEIKSKIDGLAEHAIQQCIDVRDHVGDRAENALVTGDGTGQTVEPVFVLRFINPEQAGCLQLDAAFPPVADGFENRPGNVLLRGHGIKMRTQRPGAMGIGAGEREFHAPPRRLLQTSGRHGPLRRR